MKRKKLNIIIHNLEMREREREKKKKTKLDFEQLEAIDKKKKNFLFSSFNHRFVSNLPYYVL